MKISQLLVVLYIMCTVFICKSVEEIPRFYKLLKGNPCKTSKTYTKKINPFLLPYIFWPKHSEKKQKPMRKKYASM